MLSFQWFLSSIGYILRAPIIQPKANIIQKRTLSQIVPRIVVRTAFDSPFRYLYQKEEHPLGALVLSLGARGVEPLSENLLIQLSPSAFRLLEFPLNDGGGQPSFAGSHLMHDALDGEQRVHVHRLLDAQSRAAILSGGTGGVITPRHCR